MTIISPPWLTAPETRAVMAALAPADPLFVGGCVRDALMGRKGGDVDIAVKTPPEETMRLAEAAGIGAHPTGLAHGVVTLVSGDAVFETATLRRDVATDGRRAVVAFAETIGEDAARRDFTMNALYADGGGAVLDPLGGGLADLGARRIRFIGDPAARIWEDFLRILRFFRFHAQLGIAAFDEDGLAACRAGAAGLARISRERIGAEMLKLLGAEDPEPVLATMGEILGACLPGATAFAGLVAAERRMGLPPAPLRRLAALGAATPADALRLSRKDAARLRGILGATGSPAEDAYRRGASAAADALALRAMRGVPPPANWRSEIRAGAAARFPVAAADLVAAGAVEGPEIGRRLKALEAAWIASGFAATKAELLAAPPG